MSYKMFHGWAIERWASSCLLLSASFLGAGCGGSDQPITAQKSQYEADSGDDSAAGAKSPPRGADQASTEDDGSANATSSSQPPTRSPAVGEGGDAPPLRRPPSAGGKATEADGKGGAVATDTVVDGTPEELLAELARLEKTEPAGRSNPELLANIRKWLAKRLLIADKVLTGDATEKQQLQAARAKKVVLIQMTQAGMPDIDQALRQFCVDLVKSKGPQVQQLGRITQLEMQLAKLFAGASQDHQAVVDAVTAALEGPNRDEELFSSVASAAIALQQAGVVDASLAAMKAVEEAFKNTMDERIATMLGRLGELRLLLESGFDAQADAVAKDEPMATEKFLETVQKLVANKPGPGVLDKLSITAQQFEYMRRYELANQLYAAIEGAFQDHENQELAKRAMALIATGRKRMELIGKPLVVEGKDLEGQPFDWSPYEGKIVLVDFWATWCGPCQKEIPNIKRNYDKYHEQGFEVVGVNLDQQRADLDRFVAVQPLPWSTVVDADALAEKCGVESIPFVVLIGRDGRVLDLHVRGESLGVRLAQLFNPEGKDAPPDDAKDDKPAAEKPAEAKPVEKPADNEPAAKDGAAVGPRRGTAHGFVGSDAFVAVPPATQPAAKAAAGKSNRAAKPAAAEVAPAQEKAVAEGAAGGPKLPDVNPYAPRADLKPLELVEFLDKMLDKPRSIQSRPGFSDAIVMAADRLMASPEATDKYKLIAINAKIDVLHRKALDGDDKADDQLAALVESLGSDERPAVVKAVRFLRLERKAVKTDSSEEGEIVKVLAEVKEYCGQEKLEARHLRLASNTVRLINKLENADTREKHFAEFGALFGKSGDKTLARYGKKLATPPEAKESDLVGKPIELAGRTLSGEEFQWAKYRGKVVIVDFWATWCGPCIREMPNVRALHEKYAARGFDIVGVSLDQDLDALAEFNNEHKLPWETLAGEETQELAKRYGVRGIPTMMLIDKEGKVVAVAHRVDELTSKLEQLLK